MKRSLLLGLNNFRAGQVPTSLLDANKVQKNRIDIRFRRVCHQMFLDTYGFSGGRQNPLYMLYKGFLTPAPELEFVAGSLGSHKEARIAESMKVGKAFCRSFLDEHLKVTYFAHMDQVIGKTASPRFGGVRVERTPNVRGDTPDYLCAGTGGGIVLAEAKGRQRESISFTSSKFQEWRDQFSRVRICDAQGRQLRLKGYIVATRFRTEDRGARVKSKLYCEDPYSPGEAEPSADALHALGSVVVSHHYASVFERLNLPLNALALRQGFPLPEGQRVTVGLWRCLVPPLDGLFFVGGLLPPEDLDVCPWSFAWFPPAYRGYCWNPNLLAGQTTFFGLEKARFSNVLQTTRTTETMALEPSGFNLADSDEIPDNVSILGDYSIMAPGDFMRLEEVATV